MDTPKNVAHNFGLHKISNKAALMKLRTALELVKDKEKHVNETNLKQVHIKKYSDGTIREKYE